MVRVGLTLFFLLTLGFFVLFFIHEIALPKVQVNDNLIQGGIGIICAFFGFIAYSMVGEQRFLNGMHPLKDINFQGDEEEIIQQFKNMMAFTYSSYFLPGRGRAYRKEVVQRYASYLLSIGREDAEAIKIYLKAFLYDPKNSRFRTPLLASLGQGENLTNKEIDLLLVMLKAYEFEDEFIANYLATVFLKKNQFSTQSEPLFLKAIQNQSKEAREIIKFVLPLLLKKKRRDPYALEFYLSALNYRPLEVEQIREILGKVYYEQLLKASHPEIHSQCEKIYNELSPSQRAQVMEQVDRNRIGRQLRRIRLFTSEDTKIMKALKVRMGIVRSGYRFFFESLAGIKDFFLGLLKKLILKTLDGLIWFSRQGMRTKLIAFVFLVLLGAFVFQPGRYNFFDGKQKAAIPEAANPPVSPKGPPIATVLPKKQINSIREKREHTIQIAAFTSQKQADRMVQNLKGKGVDGVYVVKSVRSSGGHWYKLRVGKFPGKTEASRFARDLKEKKWIRNYFIIALPKKAKTSPPT